MIARHTFIGTFKIIVIYFAFYYGKAQHYAGLSVDNDVYFGIDRYYSSGIFVKYGGVIKKEEDPLEKNPKIRSLHWVLGQEINTPSLHHTEDIAKMDSPYNGWLFLERKSEVFYHPDFGYGWGVQLGTTGAEASLAKWMQNTYHISILNLEPLSWSWALPQTFHLNARLNLRWGKQIQGPLKWVQEHDLQAGTFRTQLSTRTGMQLGSLPGVPFFGERLEAIGEGMAFFIGTKFIFNLHDYSLSGSIIRNKNPFVLEANPLRQEYQAGLTFMKSFWKAHFMFHSSSNYIRSQRYSNHPYLNLTIIRILS